MFGRLSFGSNKGPATAKGERIYAVGDVHGRLDLLRLLMSKIEAHHQSLPSVPEVHIILLGDLIDRGPESAETLHQIYSLQARTDRLIVLRGNHEDVMLRAIAGEIGLLQAWKRIGGIATLRSFGIDEEQIANAPESELVAALRAAIPAPMLEWLRSLPATARSGDYFFCHAGVRPGVPIRRQTREDLLWIREDFLEDDSDHGVVVVHGHSVTTEVQMRANRIGIDTGAYRTGELTAICLDGVKREILSVSGDVTVEPYA